MKKVIEEVDRKKKIVRVTVVDERFYVIPTKDEEGLPTVEFYPAVTYITAYYYKGKYFQEWLKKVGDEAELIKKLAGERGTKVHKACEDLVNGEEVRMDSKYVNPTTEEEEELTLEEYECILSFAKFWEDLTKKHTVRVVKSEFLVVCKEHEFAGTLDLVLEIDETSLHIIDIKTGQNVWPEHILQLSAYKKGLEEMIHIKDESVKDMPIGATIEELNILQLGYRRNKQGYKFTKVEDNLDVFLATQKIWMNETKNKKPQAIEYPQSITLKQL